MTCNTHVKGELEKIKCQPIVSIRGLRALASACAFPSLGSVFMKLMLLAVLCRQDATVVGIVFVLT